MKSLKTTAIALVLTIAATVTVCAQTASRNVSYHSQDIVPIRAKVKYTTLIVVPATEKIMEAATGDKDFWIVDVVGNFCFVHPAKAGNRRAIAAPMPEVEPVTRATGEEPRFLSS